jgi:3-deoxy-D-manno-octulosonic-acid transferase
LFFYLLMPFVCLRLFWRGRLVPGYRDRWQERFGFIPPLSDADGEVGRDVIWVHAVSVGETMAAVPLIRRLQTLYPDYLIAVTTSTPTGSERVKALLGDSVYHCYAPYDTPGAVSRFLNTLKPKILIIKETELWPNIIHGCYRRNIPVLLANARLSARSADGYRRFSILAKPMLAELAMVAAQHKDDCRRFLSLGLAEARVQVTGNIKFDLEITAAQRQQAANLGRQWQQGIRPIWLVASTHKGEDELILQAFRGILAKYPKTLLVLVPRHPDRFDQVAALCRAEGFAVARRGKGQQPALETQVLLGDTMGELPLFFGASDVAFVGGSLVPVGGHNLMEPAAWGIPVLSGRHLFNFAEASALLIERGGLEICCTPKEIAAAVIRLLADRDLCRQQGAAALAVVEANRGAMARLLAIIEQLLAR